jgi:endonuclease IV
LNNYIEDLIHSRKLLTIQEHDDAMEKLISSGNAIQEAEPVDGKITYTGIGCTRCGYQLTDLKETKSDPDNKKYRHCHCFRCGNTVWRRTP